MLLKSLIQCQGKVVFQSAQKEFQRSMTVAHLQKREQEIKKEPIETVRDALFVRSLGKELILWKPGSALLAILEIGILAREIEHQ